MPLTTLCSRLIVTGIRVDLSNLDLGACTLSIPVKIAEPLFRHACAEGKPRVVAETSIRCCQLVDLE